MSRFSPTLIATLLILFTIISCGGKKKKVSIPYVNYESGTVSNTGTIDVPFKLESGVKYVQVKINGLSTDMVFDTGCSTTLISVLEAQQLVHGHHLVALCRHVGDEPLEHLGIPVGGVEQVDGPGL